jgi:polyhydroxyalkanoate synthase subunit PhaC
LISAEVRFTLAAGGHIVGVINAASRNKRSFWVEGQLGKPDGLLETAR